jgi:hypothetical protein
LPVIVPILALATIVVIISIAWGNAIERAEIEKRGGATLTRATARRIRRRKR